MGLSRFLTDGFRWRGRKETEGTSREVSNPYKAVTGHYVPESGEDFPCDRVGADGNQRGASRLQIERELAVERIASRERWTPSWEARNRILTSRPKRLGERCRATFRRNSSGTGAPQMIRDKRSPT